MLPAHQHHACVLTISPVFRDQPLNIHEQLELARYFGPLHKHATGPVPQEPGLEEVQGQPSPLPSHTQPLISVVPLVVYSDGARKRPDPAAFSKLDLFHADVSYELQPPSVTSLKLYIVPEVGGDTIWSSGCVSGAAHLTRSHGRR